MEDHVRQRSTQLAAIVRDFVPSRIERQLLTQAFDLAWNCSHAVPPTLAVGSPAANDRADCLSPISETSVSQATRR